MGTGQSRYTCPEENTKLLMDKNKENIPPLRQSLFPHVPPFLNYLPSQSGSPLPIPSLLREQLWRVPQALTHAITDQGNDDDLFPESVVDIANWKTSHNGCPVNQFSNLCSLSRKDQLWAGHKNMLVTYGRMWSDIIPLSFILPSQLDQLKEYEAQCSSKHMWIVKPPNGNSGHGIQVVENIQSINTKEATIVQKYISKPYLIKGHKFDLRLYVLITSLDPLIVYLYGDGLVRFATQPYTNDPDKLQDKFIHLTNFAVNKVWS